MADFKEALQYLFGTLPPPPPVVKAVDRTPKTEEELQRQALHGRALGREDNNQRPVILADAPLTAIDLGRMVNSFAPKSEEKFIAPDRFRSTSYGLTRTPPDRSQTTIRVDSAGGVADGMSTLAHEVGHAVDFQTPMFSGMGTHSWQGGKELTDLMDNSLFKDAIESAKSSGDERYLRYAHSIAEKIAEAFSAIALSPEKAREQIPSTYNSSLAQSHAKPDRRILDWRSK